MEQHVRPRWRDRWRAGSFHVLATAAATATLGVLGGLVVVGIEVLGDAGGASTGGDAAAARLLAVVPVMVITATGFGLVAGVLSAPWGVRRPPGWTRPVIAGLIGAYHLAGAWEQARVAELAFGPVGLATSVAVALALWTAIALATVLGDHRDGAPAHPTGPGGRAGRIGRETFGAASLFAFTVAYLAVRA